MFGTGAFRTAALARLAAAATVLAAALGVVPATGAFGAERAPFDPGQIISDDSFYNPDAMTAGQIQRFLEERRCRPKDDSPCLDEFRMTTPDTPASAERCDAIPGAKKERASSIIARVAKACTISPRVLLVLLQKEQSLLTAPSASGYQKATGYACPDTAECDKRYFGFFNQVYRAAWQFREYTAHPGDWRYRIGANRIQFHPDATCGASSVRIANQATANLYNYTPYQPNDETLAHASGPAGDCSTYGNLNFSRLYTTWFGDPLAVRFGGFVPPCLLYAGGYGCDAPKAFPG
ncbi:hypothetical protein P5G50_12135 [Leifsonia sp. F6_8S_P_1B]|uniref:Hemagglutinin n=1 Tax=Leifsonia williamsii TaxID=3035919 RepID=A0ABT8KFD0_9MICO|nr:hypothetical protein [Leifsonia williamsii]MDN4615197.1 hypothetical protein [Leifsonia williamsii]